MAEKMILRFPVDPAKRDEFVGILTGALVETRDYDGCVDAQAWTPETSDSDVWTYEEWETRDHQAAYFAWRVETGLLDAIGPFLVGEPEVIWLNVH